MPRFVCDPYTLRYTHSIYRGCGTSGCEYMRRDDAPYRWKFCPECGNPLRDIRVELLPPLSETAA